MAIKLLDLSTLKRDLEIHKGHGTADEPRPPFVVLVRYLSRPTLVALQRETAAETGISEADAAKKWAGHCIAGWSGLTPLIARELNVPAGDESAAADGFIPYDAEAAATLWHYANVNLFSARITAFAFALLGTI